MNKLPRVYDYNQWEILRSSVDESVNFTRPGCDDSPPSELERMFQTRFSRKPVGVEECRFVYRPPNNDFTVYLSCQTGCAQGCRMCWLTNTGQTVAADVSVLRMLQQADRVLDYAKTFFPRRIVRVDPLDATQLKAVPAHQDLSGIVIDRPVVNYAFMARGEPLASKVIHQHGSELLEKLGNLAHSCGWRPRFKVSTILPTKLGDLSIQEVFCKTGIQPDIYWSVYSADEDFRRRWLPAALPFDVALERLVSYQRETHKLVRLHWAFIKGENAETEHVRRMCTKLRESGLRFDVNIVRYNPSSPEYGEEAGEVMISWLADQIQGWCPGTRVNWVSRVGPDVYASCGMFVQKTSVPPPPDCVTPSGRTDSHRAYVCMVDGKMVCKFCGK